LADDANSVGPCFLPFKLIRHNDYTPKVSISKN